MFSDPIVRLIRTWVPIAVATLAVNLPWLADAFNTDALVAGFIAAYYALAAYLENEVHPAFGWFLGYPKNR